MCTHINRIQRMNITRFWLELGQFERCEVIKHSFEVNNRKKLTSFKMKISSRCQLENGDPIGKNPVEASTNMRRLHMIMVRRGAW